MHAAFRTLPPGLESTRIETQYACVHESERRLARSIHELRMRLLDLERKLNSAHNLIELRTWLILFAIPYSALLTVMVLLALIRP